MIQRVGGALGLSLTCPSTVEVGDLVEISTDLTVAALSAVGSEKLVGEVSVHKDDATTCTIDTRFTRRRDDRIAGEAVSVGPFVWGPLNKVYGYTPGTRASITGTVAGPYTVVADTSDKLEVIVGDHGAVQTFTLTAGSRTAAQVVAEINATASGFTASVTADGKVKLEANRINTPLEVDAVTNNCYTLLGLTADTVVDGTDASHDSSKIAGIVIKSGAAAAAVETLEY